jgi:hypothetical protein
MEGDAVCVSLGACGEWDGRQGDVVFDRRLMFRAGFVRCFGLEAKMLRFLILC